MIGAQGVGIAGTPQSTIFYNDFDFNPGGSELPVLMDIYVGSTIVATISFLGQRLGRLFGFRNPSTGTILNNYFINGSYVYPNDFFP